jgi:hypothetical protein
LILVPIIAGTLALNVSAGDYPVPDVETVRILTVQPDVDLSVFIGAELCDALIDIIDNYDGEYRDRYVHAALCWLRVTGDERAVDYYVDHLAEYPLDCLYGLGHFSTVVSFEALKNYLSDEDEFNRRFAAESLGMLDYTVSDEMWDIRDEALTLLGERFEAEEKEWILPIIDEAVVLVRSQQRAEGESPFGQ